VNVAYSAVLTWSNPNLRSLEEQALTPMFGDHPVELGLKQSDGFVPMLRGDVKYWDLFRLAFPGDADPFTIQNVTRAIASAASFRLHRRMTGITMTGFTSTRRRLAMWASSRPRRCAISR
jgi:cytochrome c peroxidase